MWTGALKLENPIYALALIALVALAASVYAWLIPFYRRELRVEDASRLTPLDGLRGLLCFAVMAHHSAILPEYIRRGIWTSPSSVFYTQLGQNSVAFFFAVTGFLFWSRALARPGGLEIKPFLRARAFRIAPLYIFSAMVGIVAAAQEIDWHTPDVLRDSLFTMGNLGTSPWSMLGGVDLGTVDARVTWTLQYEWAFYLALPALALVAREGHARRLLLILATLFLLQFKHFDACCYFGIGIFAAHVCRDRAMVRRLRELWASVVVVLALILMPIMGTIIPSDPPALRWISMPLLAHPATLVNMVLLPVVFVPIACGNSLFGILNLSGLRLMGIASYSVYLLHGIGIYLAQDFLMSGVNGRPNGPSLFWLRDFALGQAVLLVALFTYRWIEYPFIQLEKILRKSAKAPVTAEIVKAEETAGAVVPAEG